MSKGHIFVVEDEGIVSLDIQNRLLRAGYTIAGAASSGPEAISKVSVTRPDLILMDIKLHGDMDGIATAHQIQVRLNVPIIYLTAYADEETLKRANLTAAYGYLLKPFKERELIATIQMTLTRYRLEQQLKESQQWFSTTLRSIGDAVIATDAQGRIQFMNPLAERLTGWEQETAVGLDASQVFRIVDATTLQEKFCPVAEVLQTGKISLSQNSTLLQSASGREIPIDDSAAPILNDQGITTGVVLTFRDVTERKHAEQLLLQAHKMESLGILAGGVAHDFNNLLVAIIGQTSLALTKSPAHSEVNQHLQKAVHAAEQAAELTRQLLAYSGRGQFRRQPLHLNTLIQNNQQLLSASIPKHIRIQLDLDPSLPFIDADPAQMQQMVMNLILNATEAIGNQPGTVTLRTTTKTFDAAHHPDWQHPREPLPPGQYVLLEVRDTGCGIAAAVMPNIFDPFFTTKPQGRGLGLAAILGIVRGHKGGLRLESEPGQGATFQFAFPVSNYVPQTAEERPTAVTPANSSGKVLVIDDETYVHELVTDCLALENIEVLAALGGIEGLNRYQGHQDEISLILLDLSMPDMSGAETFRKLREINPAVKIVLTSGYDKDDVLGPTEWQGLTDFLQKPYNLSTLIDMVKRHM